MSDSEAVRGVLAGNLDLFAVLYERYKDMVMACLCRILRNWTQAEELAEQAWVSAFEKLAQFDQKRNFGFWVRGFARKLGYAALRYRKRQCRPIALEDLPAGEEPSCPGPEEEHVRAQAEQAVLQWVAPLPKVQQAVMLFRGCEDMPFKELGELMGRDATTLRSDFLRGLRELRRRMEGPDS